MAKELRVREGGLRFGTLILAVTISPAPSHKFDTDNRLPEANKDGILRDNKQF